MAEVDRVADVVEGFHELVPVVFHYGHLSPDGNEKLYRALTSTLAMTFEKRCEMNKTSERAVVICSVVVVVVVVFAVYVLVLVCVAG